MHCWRMKSPALRQIEKLITSLSSTACTSGLCFSSRIIMNDVMYSTQDWSDQPSKLTSTYYVLDLFMFVVGMNFWVSSWGKLQCSTVHNWTPSRNLSKLSFLHCVVLNMKTIRDVRLPKGFFVSLDLSISTPILLIWVVVKPGPERKYICFRESRNRSTNRSSRKLLRGTAHSKRKMPKEKHMVEWTSRKDKCNTRVHDSRVQERVCWREKSTFLMSARSSARTSTAKSTSTSSARRRKLA